MKQTLFTLLGALACLLASSSTLAHGFAGKRFFPATLTLEDSFVAPELDFQYGNSRSDEDDGAVTEHVLSTEFAKPLTRDFQLSIGASYLYLDPEGDGSARGFDDLELGAKYQVFIDPDSESALAVGLEAELGGTGSKRVDAESASTFAPGLFYSRGFGSAGSPWLRPLAVSTQLAPTFSTDGDEPHALEWGFTLQYSLPYLEDFVKDVGLGKPWRNMIPIIEFPMQTCLDRGCSGHTTGTVNPGAVWVGKYSQVGFELMIPVSHDSGTRVGFLLQYHLYLDDIIPSWSVR